MTDIQTHSTVQPTESIFVLTKKQSRWLLIITILLTILVGIGGAKKNLPYVPEADEGFFVIPAMHMASSGDLNPGWFGNPGSTMIYPLTFFYHTRHALQYGESLFEFHPEVEALYKEDFSSFYLIGRVLSIFYAVLSIPLTFLIGKRAFNPIVGHLSTWFVLTYATLWWHAQVVRTDAAAIFFSLLGLWLCLKVLDKPTKLNYMLAGGAIGLSIATRYFMIALVSVLLIIWVKNLAETWRGDNRNTALWGGVLGLAAIGIVFFITTPYFFLDYQTAIQNILLEARFEHLGADGFSSFGNFYWYLSQAIPESITWWQAILALIGIIYAIVRRNVVAIILIAYMGLFIMGISTSALHWKRWIIQLLPLLAIFTAYSVVIIMEYLGHQFNWRAKTVRSVLILFTLFISLWPLYKMLQLEARSIMPTTRLLAREWIIENLPSESQIMQEIYGAPLGSTDFIVREVSSLSHEYDLASHEETNLDYLISTNMYQRFFNEAERYPDEVEYYTTLFSEAELIQSFEPSIFRGGPEIRIFSIPEQDE